MGAARAAARQTIEQTEIIQLSGEDARRLAQHLLDPPTIAPAMLRAFEHHKQVVGPVLVRRGTDTTFFFVSLTAGQQSWGG